MSTPIKAMILFLAGLASVSAYAQILGPAFESQISLKQEDINLLHKAVDTQIHGKPVGTTVSWSNPDTGNAGTVRLLKKFRRGNLACEQIEYTLTTITKAVEPEHYILNSCLTPNGWKII